jgi:hypothetical protein
MRKRIGTRLVNGRGIPVTGRRAPSRLTDGSEVVSLYPQEGSWYSFVLGAESTPGS